MVPMEGAITLKDVDFGYVPEKQVLYDISLVAAPGKRIASICLQRAIAESAMKAGPTGWRTSSTCLLLLQEEKRVATMRKLRKMYLLFIYKFLFCFLNLFHYAEPVTSPNLRYITFGIATTKELTCELLDI